MSITAELERLADLHQRGSLSDDEFARAKARMLNGAPRTRADDAFNAVNELRRSRDDRWLGGVCAGLARVSGLAAWVWRLLFGVLAVCAGCGVLVYALLWVLVPQDDFGAGSTAHAG